MLKVGLIGAGRIGQVHARAITAHPRSQLVAVADISEQAATRLAWDTGAVVADVGQILADPAIGAILIASSTHTHADLIERGTAAGKAVFCEKPIDLDLDRALTCGAVAERSGRPVMLGFNRRFDPNFAALKAALDSGEIGRPELLTLTSFDPAPPPVSYIEVSGGLFRDMMIHDFDMACWLMGGVPQSVTASGSCLVDPRIAEAGDIDTAVVILQFAGGRLATIKNSRRAAFGYDQRIEILGSAGMLEAGNVLENTVIRSTAAGITGAKPEHFFLERYMRAYAIEWDRFVAAVLDGKPVPAGISDGVNALAIAEAALASLHSGRSVAIEAARLGQAA